MHEYRTHRCGELRPADAGAEVRLSGWLHRRRDHGNLLFLDLRDASGITQCVLESGSELFALAEATRLESVLRVTGKVTARSDDTINLKLATGEIEVRVSAMEVLSPALPLPLQVNVDEPAGEEVRLRYRYLDLRREVMQRRLILRGAVIASIRERMRAQGFTEFQTPILTAASPEGARDYLVPSRLHRGKFYALPQAPQVFKQLLMVSGFDRYFQIAPCFRDEDARADRSPGEFYQLDFEMSFVTQDDVFAALEPVLHGVFEEFGGGAAVSGCPFRRIPYREAMRRYGSDKPDLRNPLELVDVSEVFRGSGFRLFSELVDGGGEVRCVRVAAQARSFCDRMNEWARGEGMAGLGYVVFVGGDGDGDSAGFKSGVKGDIKGEGPIARNLEDERVARLAELSGAGAGEMVFLVAGKEVGDVERWGGLVRDELCRRLELLGDGFEFCWVTDFPMYERDNETGAPRFSHNPFSMPQGGIDALDGDPYEVLAWQYDIVCNGVELSSGAIRNHDPETMIRAFGVAGYSRERVEEEFGGILEALRFGAPPHGGSAPGIDRIVMLLAGERNLREVVAFPMNQRAEDLLMGAPAGVSAERLRELGLRIVEED
ncbi:MAG: aspartate--tRNA ligase [Alphaproteobacteria bacterium]|nr:aspartate--tRNA ligase [Alphaproteobacteria bacterium]MDA7983614.1 aspartate--tRNA ligase [Alphaproteobacteria bacterium]